MIAQTTTPVAVKHLTPEEIEKMPVVDSSAIVKFIPLLFLSEDSVGNNTLKVVGVIREQSSAGFFCGTLCHSGTMRVDVTRVESGHYSEKSLFIVIPCFVHREEDLGKEIHVTATSLPASRDIGCFASVWNSIDSQGVPFYFCEDDRIDGR
jgi:hypothetical protein